MHGQCDPDQPGNVLIRIYRWPCVVIPLQKSADFPRNLGRRLDVMTLRLYSARMSEIAQKRATVYFDPFLHRALRLKAAETDRSISELVNEAVKASLAEDADDIEAFEIREKEVDYSFESVVKDLKRRGKL